jgi:phage tail-like protein
MIGIAGNGAVSPQQVGQLIVLRGDEVVTTAPLTSGELTIGRGPDNGLVLSDQTVSGHHARLHVEGDDHLLTDVGSTNGTTVDGVRLLRNQPIRLTDGCVIQIGGFDLIYKAPVAAPAEIPPKEPAPPTDRPGERRPTFPLPLPDPTAPSRYLQHLPMIFHENDFLRGFLLIFEAIWEPLEWRQDCIEYYADPRTCPAAFLPWLAGWLNLAFPPQWPESHMRRVLAEAMNLYRWRGTRYGLERIIEVYTGLTPLISERPDQPYVFFISLTVPAAAGVDQAQLDSLIRTHKPAHAGYVLDVVRERAS